MIKHIVCFKIKDEYKDTLNDVKELMLSMKDHIDYIKDIKVGLDFLHSERSYDLILEVILENKEDLDRYQENEYHCSKIKTLMAKIRVTSIAVDYEF